MIRQDFFMRMVQELMQSLQRVLFLKKSQKYEAALEEIERTLARFWDLTPAQVRELSLEEWLALCSEEEGGLNDKLVALADLVKEQGDLYALKDNTTASQRSYALALGLYLETLHTSMVSVDLIEKTDALISQTGGAALPSGVLKRLFAYYEARGAYAEAEDALFAWLETGDAEAAPEGLAFYERLLAKPEEELQSGDLPRAEVEEGRQELLKRKAH